MKKLIAAVAILATMVINSGAVGMFYTYYEDVPSDTWYTDAVVFVTDNGYMSGSDGYFRPNDTLTRAEVVQILQNLELPYDHELPAYPFADVAGTEWYGQAALHYGMFIGGTELMNMEYDPVKGFVPYFRPNDPVTREELAVGIYNASVATGLPFVSDVVEVSNFTDREMIAETTPLYPYEMAIATMAKFNVINGYSDGTFRPKNHLTRAEMAQIIQNMYV